MRQTADQPELRGVGRAPDRQAPWPDGLRGDPGQAPLVSVIMSNYRGAPFLRAAIRSVLAQSHRTIELIVVDDASDDGSAGILDAAARADGRVQPILLDRNRGPAGARNVALDHARGDWIALVDSDDLIHPRRIQRLLQAAAVTGADMLADTPILFGDAMAGTPLLHRDDRAMRHVGPVDLIRSDTGSAGTSSLGYLKPMIRRNCLGALRYDETLRIGEDFDLYFRLLLEGATCVVLPDPTYLYRRHGGSVSHRLSVAALDGQLAAQDRITALYQTGAPLDAALGRRRAVLRRAQDYERLVAAIKARRMAAAGLHLLQRPALLANLGTSLWDRAHRARARDPRTVTADAQSGGTLVLAAPDRIAAVAAPDGAERIAVTAMRPPASSGGSDHLTLACRLARLGSDRLDVIAHGPEGVHALGYLPTWRSASVYLPGSGADDLALPAGAVLRGTCD